MLINKELLSLGYIFVNNVNLQYLRILVELGSKPIFIKIIENKRIPVILYKEDLLPYINIKGEYIRNDDLFKYNPCTISDIKGILGYLALGLEIGISIEQSMLIRHNFVY